MKKKLIIIFSVILIIALIGLSYHFLMIDRDEGQGRTYIMEIPEWGYKLESNATDLMITEFEILKDILMADEVDETAYAEAIARLFIIDLFTMNIKLNKYDVGGSQFILPSFLDNFRLNVQNTIYRFLEDNTAGNRDQQLPEVNGITIVNQERTQFEIEDEIFEAYRILLTWTYVTDMGYDNEAYVILIKEGKFFHVVEKNRSI